MTEQEGQRRRKDRAGWEGVGGVGGGGAWKEGGSKKLEERRQELVLPGPGASFCSQRPDFNHSRTMEGIVNPDWQNCYVVETQACYRLYLTS